MSEYINSSPEEVDDDTVRRLILDGLTGYISAGGRGTRLTTVFAPDPNLGVSKALLSIGRPPIPLVDHHINKLRAAGVANIIAGVGDHDNVAEHVEARYADQPNIDAIQVQQQLGNGGDLIVAVREHPDRFKDQVYVANVDTMLDIDEASLAMQHVARGAELTIALTRNKGVPNEGAFYVTGDDRVIFCREAADNALTESDAASSASIKAAAPAR